MSTCSTHLLSVVCMGVARSKQERSVFVYQVGMSATGKKNPMCGKNCKVVMKYHSKIQ